MNYDPIKHALVNVFNKSAFSRKAFYKLLDLLLLRTWHVHKELKTWAEGSGGVPSILDAGSGFGQYTYYLSGLKPTSKILAVDVKEDQIQECEDFFRKASINNVDFQYADLVKFRNPDAYDLILSVDVMEHILEDVQVFDNFYHSLKNGGMLLISTPSDQGGSDAHEDNADSFIGEHVRNGYNINEIQDKLRSVGFGKIEARYAYGTPGKISWRLSMKYPIQMLGVSKLFFVLIPFYYLLTYPFAFVLNYMDVNSKHATGTGLVVKAWK
jgi:SAM-dependent methyltransferase